MTASALFAPGGGSPYGEPRGYWDALAAAGGSSGPLAGRGADDDDSAPGGTWGEPEGAAAVAPATEDGDAAQCSSSDPRAGVEPRAVPRQQQQEGRSSEAAASVARSGGLDGTAPPPGKRARLPPGAAAAAKQRPRPYPGARHGELVHTITVRGADDQRTGEYQALLHELGKPG